ncbi:MAG TPA: FliI/YscN family ATPase [Gemmataceae bacterium]|nr:FliI/YscN family ATPase [Gemmataceae bacterium]
MLKLDLKRLCREITEREVFQTAGKLRSATGLLLSCTLPAAVGDTCEIQTLSGGNVLAEVIGFANGMAHLAAFERGGKVHPGMPVVRKGHGFSVPVGDVLLGRVLDGLGRPMDNRGPLRGCEWRSLDRAAPVPLERARIQKPFITGQRVLDGLLTLGQGQRVGIFAGSGVGKSTLLGEIAKGSAADVNVIALVGERGREVRPFLDDCIGKEGMAKSVVVVATSDQTPLMRVRAAQVAITIADAYRDRGANVLLMMDSLTRLAMAQRELGLALGEPPSARGYTPSVFQLLADTVERLGNGARGSITGILTVLVDGGDLDEPISDSVRSLVDGHIVLDRRLAERGHYPAVNVGRSVSRTAHEVTNSTHQEAARKLREILATYTEAEDLIRIGAYAKGTSPQVDRAVELMPAVLAFLKQRTNERSTWEHTETALAHIAASWPF